MTVFYLYFVENILFIYVNYMIISCVKYVYKSVKILFINSSSHNCQRMI